MDAVFFYINRSYAILIAIWAILAEFYALRPMHKYCRMCGWYFSRGFLQLFLGLWTLQAGFADPKGTQKSFSGIAGYVVIGVAMLNLILELCCLTDSQDEADRNIRKSEVL